jgi:hypothetical protein
VYLSMCYYYYMCMMRAMSRERVSTIRGIRRKVFWNRNAMLQHISGLALKTMKTMTPETHTTSTRCGGSGFNNSPVAKLGQPPFVTKSGPTSMLNTYEILLRGKASCNGTGNGRSNCA